MMRVLIIDDNLENLYLLRMLLQGYGYDVDEARHGADALVKARQNPPDLVISDLLMPVMDGYTLLRQWKADEHLKRVPFVVYTATYTEPRDEHLARNLGADAFITKPAEPEPFMEVIQEVLAKAAREELPITQHHLAEETVLLEEYNEVLVRKLEKRAQQLEQVNRELLEEIAERKQTEAALRDSEERYRNLFQAITDPLFVYDRVTLGYLAVNEAAVTRYGYSHDEFLGMTIKDICPPEDIPAMLDLLTQSGTLTEERRVWRHQKKNGEIIEVEISIHGLEFAGRPASLVEARDVTEQRRAEAEVTRTNHLLQAVAEGTLDAVFVKDRDGKYLLLNDATARFVGKPVAEVLGQDDLALFGPEGAKTVRASDCLVMESNQVHTFEELLVTPGGPRTFQAIKAPYRDESGNVIGVIGVSRDITERKQLEDQLRQSQKMEAIGRVAGGIAHDFNNLLTVISGYSTLLLKLPEATDTIRKSVTAIKEASDRATALTRQLLGFSRQTMLQPKILDLNTVIADTGKMLCRLIGEDILFTTVLAPNLSPVKVDPSQLDQILMNLVVNARDAMPRGGRLTIETANVILSHEYAAKRIDCKPGPHVLLAITDTGCGMPPEVITRIFEPFFTTKEVGKGTGLGLAMVFGIVQQSGGCIHVYSEPGHGTTFKIYFPAIAEEVTEQTESAPNPAVQGTETILIVEDEQQVRELASVSLEMYGYRILTATDGKEALQIVLDHRGPIDLVLTDVVMPNMSGPELVEHLQAQSPGMKVLYMSGYTEDAVVRHGLLRADVSFIQKPYSPLSLAQKVRQVLDEKNQG